MNRRESEQRVNAYVSRKLAEMAEEREGDLRVTTAGLGGMLNSEVLFNIREYRDGEWKMIHEKVNRIVVLQVTRGYFVCRNQSIVCGDYRKREPVVLIEIPCVACGREYTFPQRGPSHLSVNGYCSVACAIAAGVAPDEASHQEQEHMVYIGE